MAAVALCIDHTVGGMRRVVVLAMVVGLAATPVVGGPPADAAGDTSQPAATDDLHDVVQSAAEPTDDQDHAADRRAAQSSATISKEIELSLTPDAPGQIGVEVTYTIPEEVTRLTVSVPTDAEDVSSTSFSPVDGQYEWNGETNPASLSFTLPANQSASGARSPSLTQHGEYSFVDTGPWAMVTVPGLRSGWEWRGPDDFTVTLRESVDIAGEGSTGGEIAFLGPMQTHERTAGDQNFTLVVPEAASMAATPEAVLDALAGASSQFHVGERDDDVWFAAAPTDTDWGVRGVEYGGSDAWVLADSPLSEASNVWFHEYVHTRQAFDTATSGRWTTEAGAEYYSALLALRTGHIDFDSFQTYLSYGEREPWRNAVLADPTTWAGGGANYVKGSLVWGAIDRRVRVATNSTYTMSDVFYELNQQDERVTNGDVLVAVGDVAGTDTRAYALEHTETEAVPEMWTRRQHAEAFSTEPPHMTVQVGEYRVEGPFRNDSFSTPPTLYVGERLTVQAAVTNEGGQSGEYTASLGFDGTLLAKTSGTLDPSAADDVALSSELGQPGTYTLSVGRESVELTAREPASIEVSDVSVSSTEVDPGEDVTATVELSNPTTDYARGPVDLVVDGERSATLDATLGPGESTTRTVTVTLSESGEYTIGAGEQSATVTVGDGNGSASDDTGTDTRIPGFGVAVALVSLAGAALLAGRN